MGRKKREVKKELLIDTPEDWDSLKNVAGIVVVDVHTEWAGPCNIMKRIVNSFKLEVQNLI